MTEQVRRYQVVNRVSEQYRSRMAIECPFCQFVFPAHNAAFARQGKRCMNKKCQAHHKPDGTATLCH